MKNPAIVGTEWLIEAKECDAEKLRDLKTLQQIFAKIIKDLGLKTLGKDIWHKFGGEGGVTGLVALTESHLACHTYPEYETATFNLYCCKTRPEWDWDKNLSEMLGAEEVAVTKIERGNAVVPTAVGNASRIPSNFPKVQYGEITKRSRGRLPHWEKDNGIYFVTFRLADSLPKNVTDKLKFERAEMLRILEKTEKNLTNSEQRKINQLFSEKIDEYLDAGYGDCILQENRIAEIVSGAIQYFDAERYDVFSWCVMPNHVHIVFRILKNNTLDEILHTWKSYTSHEINNVLKQTGKVWQREYYDRLIRNAEEFFSINKYVLHNPLKAGLKNWKWVGGRMSARRTHYSQRDAGVTPKITGGASS